MTMIMKLGLVACFLAGTLSGCLSSPLSHPVTPNLDITPIVNGVLTALTAGMEETITLTNHTEIPILFEDIFDLLFKMDDVTLTGLKDITAFECTSIPDGDKNDVELNFHLPTLSLFSPSYNMDGMVVDHIHLVGDGTFSIIAENTNIKLYGRADVVGLPSPSALFESVAIDIDMKRWTVDFEGLMPGTDLGTVFNEFFSMVGPEMMDLLEIKLNEGDALLNFINGIFGPDEISEIKEIVRKYD